MYPFVVKKVPMLSSVTVTALSSALDGLSARQAAIANNIANINTPNYHAQRVSFESALAASVKAGSGFAAPVTQTSLEPTDTNGNNENLDTETVSNTDTVLRYQFATQAINKELNSILPAMRLS